MLRAADVYGVGLVVLGGGALPPEPLGHPTDTTQAWRRIAVKFADEVLDVLPDECVAVAVERVAEATPLPEFEHPESAAYLFGPGHECSNLGAPAHSPDTPRRLSNDNDTHPLQPRPPRRVPRR